MQNKFRRIISVLLSVFMSFALIAGTGSLKAQAAEIDLNNAKQTLMEKANKQFSMDSVAQFISSKYGISGEFNDNLPPTDKDPEQIVRVVVETEGAPYVQSDPGALKTKGLTALNAAIAKVKSQNKSIMDNAVLLKGAVIRHSYGFLFNGFSMDVKRSEIECIKSLPGVMNVTEATAYTPDMKYAKGLTQVYDVWNDLGYSGEGMVVAIVDTGIDINHKDMVLTHPDNAKIKNISPGFTNKVPYGYNFADNNDDVLDKSGSMHGMHVAGIVAANGTSSDEEGLLAIKGVAPEAQLLAMKVFSNDPNNPYAYTDDLIAAIEDSVLHNADVINMSLGSPSGFQDPDDPEQKAIKNAADAGVMVVVSAGNEYYSTYPYNFSAYGAADTSVIGSPGLTDAALQVASFNNTNVVSAGIDYTNDDGANSNPIVYTTSELDPVGILNDDGGYELVDCGIGSPELIPDTVAGKIALIQRGTLDFVTKKLNAQAKGAVGVIIYDNRNGEMVNMATDSRVTIPAVFITQNDGLNLKNMISSNLKVFFNGSAGQIANPVKDQMSAFSSWGPTPNLDFKPEITAPGGSIYSTVNNDKYESMSGTSMAAPHTSGAEALILQSLGNSITGKAKVEFAKAVTINTASPITDPTTQLPYSPRSQGAGLLQIKSAIQSNAIVTDKTGSPTVALKQIGKTTTYNLTIKNYGDTPVIYTLGSIGGVLTDSQSSINAFAYDRQISGATIEFSEPEVTVPAAAAGSPGSAQVQVTITLPNDFAQNHYVEGFIHLTPNDGSPVLVSPFMGYYGDWSALPIVDAPMWDFLNTIFASTTLIYNYSGGYYYLGYVGDDKYGPIIDPSAIGISPDDDGYKDSAIPALYLLRNAKELKVRLLDENNKKLRDIASYANLRKNRFNNDGGLSTIYDFAAWDGKLYDSASGKYTAAPEGLYYMEIEGKIDFDGTSTQTFTMPVKVDLTGPQITVLPSSNTNNGNYTLNFTLDDDGTGVSPFNTFVIVNNESLYEKPDITVDAQGVYSCTFPIKDGINEVLVGAEDMAGNYSELKKVGTLDGKPFSITFDNLSAGMEIQSDQVVDGIYTITGSVNYGNLNKLQLNGVDADIHEDLTFSVPVSLESGFKNKVHVYIEDNAKNILADYSIPVYYDGGAPVVDITSPAISNGGIIYTNQDTITLAGTVADSFPFRFYVNGDEVLYNNNGDGTSIITAPFAIQGLEVTDGCTIELKAIDESVNRNEWVQTITVKVDKAAPEITITGVENDGVYMNTATPVATIHDESPYTSTMTLDGDEYDGSVITVLGQHTLAVTAVDLAGNQSERQVTFTIRSGGGGGAIISADTTPPTVITTSVNMKLGDSFVVEFSEPVQQSDKFSNIAVSDSKGKAVQVGKSLTENRLTLTSQGTLEYGEVYTVAIPAAAVADLSGNKLAQNASVHFTMESQNTAQYYRLSGSDRYETCAKVVQQGWETSDYAVLVTGENYPDALSAAPLAKKYNAPILITEHQALTPVIESEIARMKVKKVFIVGGNGAVSSGIENLLTAKYGIECTRIAGNDRYETSVKIAGYLGTSNGAVIASGDGYADALSIASYAAAKEMPILLVEKNSIPASVSKFITDNSITKTYIVGGYGVVSKEVERLLPNPSRYAGNDRYGTNAAVIKELKGEFSFDIVYIATGENFADALSGAALAAKTHSPIILVSNDMSPETIKMVKEIVSMAKAKYILGGEASVGVNTLDNILK